MQETPDLAPLVAAGKLPPIAERIPRDPAVAELESIGRPGGELRMLMASPKDTRLMCVYGYARLVAYTPSLALVPDILENIEVEAERSFTLRLRHGHKWSDGKPFTAEDFRYWFEDIAQNETLSPAGLPVAAARRTASGRASRCSTADRALQLVAAQPAVPAGAGRAGPALHLCPGALPEAVPRQNMPTRRSSNALVKEMEGAQLGGACSTKWAHVPQRQSGPAVARSPGY